MGSTPKNSEFSLRRNPRKLRGRRSLHARACRRARRRSNASVIRSTGNSSSKVLSGKLEALRSLIPTHNGNNEVVKADRLFQETADYILKLRTQVFIMQRMVEFYGSGTTGEGGNVCSSTL